MNQAVAQGLVFGKQIVFTFGPYACIYTRWYHPATHRLMIYGGLYLGICYATLLLFLSRRAHLGWLLLLSAFFISGILTVPDMLLHSYPLLLAAFVYRISVPNQEESAALCGPYCVPSLFILFLTPLGLLPLIKGTLFLICGIIALLSFIILWRRQRFRLAFCSLFVPLLATPVFWRLSGQPLSGLPYYVFRMIPIISGYSEAMAAPGNVADIVVYLLGSAGILLVIITARDTPLPSRLYLFFSFAAVLFITFKGGFVRHDSHAIISGTTLLFAGILLIFLLKSAYVRTAFFIVLLAWSFIDQEYVASSTSTFYNHVDTFYDQNTTALKARLFRAKKRERARFAEYLDKVAKESHIPLMKGTTDIYSYDQADLFASGNRWNPRPVIQSYAAYTPALARLNESHLRGDNAPDNLIFNMEPIDGRLPSLEDGLSWPTIMTNYTATAMREESLYLARNSSPGSNAKLVPLISRTAHFGEKVSLPSSLPLFAELEINPTFIGRIISFLLKPPALQITLTTLNGTHKVYRIVSGMARAGFVISPLVENTEDFALLLSNPDFLKEKEVQSIEISTVEGNSISWRQQYGLKLFKVEVETKADIHKLMPFDAVEEQYSHLNDKAAPISCDAVIDTVNGITPMPANAKSERLLSVIGWFAISGQDGIVPDAVYVTLTDQQGNTSYVRTRRTPRSDVKAYFKHPEMPDVGYITYADVSNFRGNYILGLARLYNNQVRKCQAPELPISIAGRE